MSDFNIKKFLAENVEEAKLSYDDFTANQKPRPAFKPNLSPVTCPECDGSGTAGGRIGIGEPDCETCGGQGEIFEGYDDYEGWNDNADEFEPAINMCPSCEGEGCEECGGEGAIHEDTVSEGNADEMAREVAQDMIDSGFAAVSDANFDEMYETFMDRYREGWGWPESFREDVRAAYKAILKKKAMSGSDFNEDADLGKMLENAGIAVETKDQGAAPGAQLKGKQGIKKGGVKGYDDDHPASGQLVGESDDVGNWHDHDRNDNYDDDPLDDMTEFGDEDAEFFGYDPRDDDPWALGSDKEDIGAKYRKSDDNPFGTEGNGYDDAQLDKYDTEHGLVDPFGLEEELLAEYEDEDDEDYYSDLDDEMYGDEDEPRGPFIDGEYTRRSYWNKNGGYQNASDKLQDLIPGMGEVEDHENNPALENFRIMGNVYYDVHNNGGYGIGEGYGQRYEEMVAITGWDENEIYSYEELENAVDDVVEAAWFEQLAKGTVTDTDIDVEENFSGAFATGPMVQEDDDHIRNSIPDEEFGPLDDWLSGPYDSLEGAKEEAEFMWGVTKGNVVFKDKKGQFWINDGIHPSTGEEFTPDEIKATWPDAVVLDEDEDDDFIGKGEMDMGSDTIVGPGDLVQVDSSLGGEATVVAQRPGYVVVNLPKGGMKLLRDDEWWIDDEDGGGMDDGYVDVEYDDEEPEELAFEGGKDFWTDVGDTLNRDGTVQGLAGRQLKRAGKSMKRGLKGWGGYSKPADMVKKHQGYSDEELKSLQRMPSDIKGTPAALQQKLVKRNLRKRGHRDFEKHMDEDQAAVMPQHSQDDRQDPLFREGYKILPPMDPKYIERDGLEGPFPTRSGKVVYYDPKEGKYYDPDTDIYMSNDEYAEYDRDPDMEYPEFTTPAPKPRERGRMDEAPGMMKKFAKHMKRGMGNWDGNVGHNYPADSSEPFNIMDRVRNYSTEELKDYMEQHKGHKPSSWSDTFVKLAKRELRRRGERDFEKYMTDSEQLELDVDNVENTGAYKMGYKLGASGGKVSYHDNEAMGPDMPIFSKGYHAGKATLGEEQLDEFTQEQRLLKHFNTTYGQDNSLRAFYDEATGEFKVLAHGDNHYEPAMSHGEEVWRGSADEFGSKYNIKNRYGIEEAGEWYGGPSRRMQQKMHSELGHEDSWNNYAIFIDGKHWKTVKGSQHAQAIVRTLQKKGKNAEWKYGAYPMSEGDSTHKKGWKKKGGGYNKPGSKAGKKASSKAQRKDDKKAIAAEGSAHDESWLPKTWARKTDESLTDGQGSKTRTYTGDLATTEVEPPYGGFSRLGMKDLAEWIKLRKDYPRWEEMVKKAKKVLNDKRRKARYMKGKRPTATKYKYTIAKQVGGDDGYQWAVIDKQANRIMVSGLTKPEVKHYRDRAERDLAAKYEASLQHELEPGEEVLDELFDDQLSEIETATDQLDQDRDVGEPTELAGTAADSDAELAGMQQIMKNMLNEPDQDMEDAIQKMAIADPDQEEVSLDNDELAQLQQLLGLLK